MTIFLNSFLLVFLGEMGDKTQLLTLVLAARFRKPWTILAGIFIATIINHALAAWAGEYAASFVSPEVLKWSLAAIFIGFGIWILVPDKEGELKETGHWGALITTIISFFLAEMGDKTQLATVALGARYGSVAIVTLGTTLGMLASNALAIYFGEKFLKRVPMKYVRMVACAMFLVFAGIVVWKGVTI